MLRYRLPANILRSALNKSAPLRQAATYTETLQLEQREEAPPLVILPGQLERVKQGVPGHSTVWDELRAARALEFVHAPVERFILEDCIVHEAGVEYSGGYYQKAPGIRARLIAKPSSETKVAAYCMNSPSHLYFGHWLRDACATALLPNPSCPKVLDLRQDWPDAVQYLSAFELQPLQCSTIFVKELHMFSDYSQGTSKRSRYIEMKGRLKNFYGESALIRRPVYLRRGRGGAKRKILNESQLCETLSRVGFDIVDLESTSFLERYRILSASPAVVSVEGSHVNHAYFAMRQGSALLALIPGDRFTMIHRGVAHAMGFKFGCVVMNTFRDGYTVEVDEILQTLERML